MALGMCAQSVHERLVRLGAVKKANLFSEEDRERLIRDYDIYVSRGDLQCLADEMGRTKHFICRKARSIGLTNARRKAKSDPAKISEKMKQWIAENGHPRGMAGKSHTQATKAKIAENSKAVWAEMSEDQKSEFTLMRMKARVAKVGNLNGNHERGSWKAGWREIGGKRNYYRSRWEANYARYLEWLKSSGEIAEWKHEPETFWFEAIKRGVRSYKPDFRVWEKDGSSTLHEVKGWMCPRSKTCLARMARYHPNEVIILIAAKQYNAIAKSCSSLVEGWEQ